MAHSQEVKHCKPKLDSNLKEPILAANDMTTTCVLVWFVGNHIDKQDVITSWHACNYWGVS